MSYVNRNFTWDFNALKRFYEKYVIKWINSAVSWTDAQKKQARANLGFGDGDIDDKPTAGSANLLKSGGAYKILSSFGNNLFSVYEKAVREDGSVTTSTSNIDSTPFIYVKGCTHLSFEGCVRDVSSSIVPYAFYDENKDFIEGSSYTGEPLPKGRYEIYVPDRAVYVRCTTATNIYSSPYIVGFNYAAINNAVDEIRNIANKNTEDCAKAAQDIENINNTLFETTEDIVLPTATKGYIIKSNGRWTNINNSYIVNVTSIQGKEIKVEANESINAGIAFLQDNTFTDGVKPNYCEGYDNIVIVSSGSVVSVTVPDDCNYLYVWKMYYGSPSVDHTPKSLKVIISEGALSNIEEELSEHDKKLTNIKGPDTTINLGTEARGYINEDFYFKWRDPGTRFVVDVSERESDYVEIKAGVEYCAYGFLTDATYVENAIPSFIAGYEKLFIIPAGEAETVYIPEGTNYLYVFDKYYNVSPSAKHAPEYIRYVEDIPVPTLRNFYNQQRITTDIVSLNNKSELDDRFYQCSDRINFLHFSDIHGNGANFYRIMDFYRHYSEYISDIINTGDLVEDKYIDSIAFINSAKGERVLNVIGNHETRSYVEDVTYWDAITEEECYAKFIAPFMNNWGSVVTVENKAYYYKDYNNSLRLIVYDVMHPNADQNTWLANILEDARVNGLHVIIAKHSPTLVDGGRDEKISCNFSSADKTLSAQYYMSENTKPIVRQFIDAGGTFICYLCGHTHFDFIGSNDSYPKQYSITVASASYKKDNSQYHRAFNSINMDLFNIISVNTDTKIISLFRVGCKHDTYNRNIESFVFDYDNCKVISD